MNTIATSAASSPRKLSLRCFQNQNRQIMRRVTQEVGDESRSSFDAQLDLASRNKTFANATKTENSDCYMTKNENKTIDIRNDHKGRVERMF